VNRVAELTWPTAVGSGAWLGVMVYLLVRVFRKSFRVSAFCESRSSQLECDNTGRKDALLTRIAEWMQWLWIPLWLFAYADKEMLPMLLALLQYLGLGILLCVFLALYETLQKMDSYKNDVRMTPNEKS
jgi:hypothetical protein